MAEFAQKPSIEAIGDDCETCLKKSFKAIIYSLYSKGTEEQALNPPRTICFPDKPIQSIKLTLITTHTMILTQLKTFKPVQILASNFCTNVTHVKISELSTLLQLPHRSQSKN